MPQSPFDDPFAELFGKLPDPRSRDRNADRDSAPQDPATEPERPETPSTPQPARGAPLSRREAREAAARAAAAPASSGPAREESSAPIDPIPLDGVFTLRHPSQPIPVVEEETDPAEAWLLAGASRARAVRAAGARTEPASSPAYARTGQVPLIDAAAPERPEEPALGLDELFSSSRSPDDLGAEPVEKKRRRRRIGGWIALGVVLAILGGIAAGGWYVWTTYEEQIREVFGWQEPKDYEAGLATGEALVVISSGDLPAQISESLYNAGVTKTSDAFYDHLIETQQNPTFYPGVYSLQQKMTSEAALASLQDPANKREFTAQLREGLTVEESLPLLADGTGIPLEELQAAVADPRVYGVTADPAIVAAGGQPLEGWLFPATYTFDPGVTAQGVIQTLVDRTVQSLDAAGVPAADRQRILTIASVIQSEARYEADMQKVSRVIENRLDAGNQETFGLLQMDSTAQYGYGETHSGSASTSAEAQYDDNPWNTYVRTGLPIGPISNPGDVAISSAMSPADGDWLYFVTVDLDTGETVFTSNAADHEAAVAQWQAWCVDHPDSGC